MKTYSQKIKGIQTQICQLESDIELDKMQISTTQKQMTTKQRRLSELKAMEKALTTKKELIVSEHAILRYLERVCGLNIEDTISRIKNDQILSIYNQLGNSGKYPCDEFSAVVRDNVIVTIEV